MIGLLQGLAVWVGAAVAVGLGFGRLKRREARSLGRFLLARDYGVTTDTRYTSGPHAGRWRSEVVADDFENHARARTRWQ